MTPEYAAEYITESDAIESVLTRSMITYFNAELNALRTAAGLPTVADEDAIQAVVDNLEPSILHPED